METNEPNRLPSPYAVEFASSTSLLRDISNFKTPKRSAKLRNIHPQIPSPSPRYFTAIKKTPATSSRRRISKFADASVKMKVFELEQRSIACRKEAITKELSLKSVSKSLRTWLNFLLQNPESCGCLLEEVVRREPANVLTLGKREGGGAAGWRCPKRQRVPTDTVLTTYGMKNSYATLRISLADICSLDDLKERMRAYLSMDACKDVVDVMAHVFKNIDEGRLKMKKHCPIVTDVGMKEKATRVLMSYNPFWLRIGLQIIFGGELLLPDGNETSEAELMFLNQVIERQFFSHAGLAKDYAYNKKVEGLYRPGYYQNLGNVLLKRFLLLVLILDKAKMLSALPLKYGIDGVDGGSPLLFNVPALFNSSSLLINGFLSSEVMHGEGNVVSHLDMLGYQVSYEQIPLVEYNFQVNDLFLDLQDGIRLSRAIQLLLNDCSILTKLTAPTNTCKKKMMNSRIALDYLRCAGVPLLDEDGFIITEDDLVAGDKELTISLLWSMFVNLQLPLLLNKSKLSEELLKINECIKDSATMLSPNMSTLDLLFTWVQIISAKYDYVVDSFASLVDGKAIWCILDFYFRQEFHCPRTSQDNCRKENKDSFMSSVDYTDAVYNFILSQRLTTLLGNFPEVLQMSDILEYRGAPNYRCAVILLVFLATQLILKKSTDQLNFHTLLGCDCQTLERRFSRIQRFAADKKARETNDHDKEDAVNRFKTVKEWWKTMAEKNGPLILEKNAHSKHCFSKPSIGVNIQREKAATLIQAHMRKYVIRRRFQKIKAAVNLLQTVTRAWIFARNKCERRIFKEFVAEDCYKVQNVWSYIEFFVQRHRFVTLKTSIVLIQRKVRFWLTRRPQNRRDVPSDHLHSAALVIQKKFRTWVLRNRHQNCQLECTSPDSVKVAEHRVFAREFTLCCQFYSQHSAATKIQAHFRGWKWKNSFALRRNAAIRIQRGIRQMSVRKQLSYNSAILIQAHVRGWMARKLMRRQIHLLIAVQRCYRGWISRKHLLQRKSTSESCTSPLCLTWSDKVDVQLRAALHVQRFCRGRIARKMLLEYNLMVTSSVLKLQRWWRGVRMLKRRTNSAILVQSHVRGLIARTMVSRWRRSAIVIQSCWKAYTARKECTGQLVDLRLRIQNSSKNVEDSMRIINRLIAALFELENMKSTSGILHTCITLDTTTQHSRTCCEKLVDSRSIFAILKLIRSVSRSRPDQEILKHCLTTLKNLARYPRLLEALIESKGAVETLVWELLRNKDDGFFIAADILKKICATQKGVNAVRRLPAFLKRLHCLIEEQNRKIVIERRNPRSSAARDKGERRLQTAVELFQLIGRN